MRLVLEVERMKPFDVGVIETESYVRTAPDCSRQIVDQISLRSFRHGPPVPQIYDRPVVETIAVFRRQDDALGTGSSEDVLPLIGIEQHVTKQRCKVGVREIQMVVILHEVYGRGLARDEPTVPKPFA